MVQCFGLLWASACLAARGCGAGCPSGRYRVFYRVLRGPCARCVLRCKRSAPARLKNRMEGMRERVRIGFDPKVEEPKSPTLQQLADWQKGKLGMESDDLDEDEENDEENPRESAA